MYKTWRDIVKIREENGGMASTNLDRFLVYEVPTNEHDSDAKAYNFSCYDMPPPIKKGEAAAKNVSVFCDLWVNNKKVATTREVTMDWPKYELAVDEMFQVNTFTMPSSIKLVIKMQERSFSAPDIVGIVNVPVPGMHVKTLTCAA